jgi:hypothetical protein
VVNLSLARGLRSVALDEYRKMAERYDLAASEAMTGAVLSSKWTAKTAKALAKVLAERCSRRAFTTMVTHDGVTTTISHFAPRVDGERLLVDLVRYGVHPRHRPSDPTSMIAVELAPHAVERLFLRLRTMDTQAVQSELRTALFVALPLRMAAESMGLKQVPVPTRHGTLLCDGNGQAPLLARTWLRDNQPSLGTQTMAPRWERVSRAIADAVAAFGAPHGAHAPARLMLAAVGYLPVLDELVPRLTEALRPFPWLAQPYVAGRDESDDTWDRARAQAACDA